MRRLQWIFNSFLILLLSGCATSSGRAFTDEAVDATVIFSSINGEGLGQSPGAAWIHNKEELLSSMNKITRLSLGGEPTTIPPVDYGREGVLIIWMGRRPTGGYNIELASDKIAIQGKTATLKIHWIEPPQDAVLTQAITGPCIMISVTKGIFNLIKAVDQNNIIRAEVEVETGEQ